MNIAPGRKALVTGGASGLGLAVARRLAREHATVALLDVDAQRLETAAAEIGNGALPGPADVRSASDVRAAVERAIAKLATASTRSWSARV